MLKGECIKEVLNLAALIVYEDENNLGIHFITSGFLNPALRLLDSSDIEIRLMVLSLIGNICLENYKNRELLGEMGMHLKLITHLYESLEANNNLYDPKTTTSQ